MESSIFTGEVMPELHNIASRFNNDRAKTYAEMKNMLPGLRNLAAARDQTSGVRNENSFSSSLTTNFLILGATTQVSPRFAPLPMFCRDAAVDPYKPLSTGQMKFNTTTQGGSTALTNATNFESGDSTVTGVAIQVNQYTEPFHITNAQLNSGLRLADLIDAKMADLGSKIMQVLCTNITAANYATLAPLIESSASFGVSDMGTMWGELKKARRKHIMLDGPYLKNIINTPTFLQTMPVVPGAAWKDVIGWDYVALNTEWSAAGNNIIGFACDPQALGIIAGLPLIDGPGTNGILGQATGTLTGVDIPIAVYTWFNTSTRTYWASFDIMFGAVPLDTTAGLVIASGTPS